MGNLSTYTADLIAKWLTQDTDMPSAPGIIWVSLHTADPTADGSQNEISDTGYSREATDAPGDWNYTASGTISDNSAEVIFDAFDASVGDVTHFALWDGDTQSDNALIVSELDDPRTGLGDGDFIRFQVGDLSVDPLEFGETQ